MAEDRTQLPTNAIRRLEITPMRDLSALPDIVVIRPARPGETPDLWSVIARMQSGAGEVLTDEASRISAMAFARRFRRRLRQTSLSCLVIVER